MSVAVKVIVWEEGATGPDDYETSVEWTSAKLAESLGYLVWYLRLYARELADGRVEVEIDGERVR